MKRVYTSFAVAALAVVGLLIATAPSYAASTDWTATPQLLADMGSMNFGSPPSGEIPILYNDHHVYSNPSELKNNRTLAALVKNGVILVPLRSMFEAMGATVTWDSASKTATAHKEGASVQVTLGKTEAVINGESRPLDVPPEMYKGNVVVPVRVMSEALGAYVQWVPDRRITVVRYIPPTPVPTPPPTPPPTPVPTPAPTPTPTPAPAAPSYLGYVEGAYVFHRVSNEFAAQATTTGSYQYDGALLFDPFAIEAGLRSDQYSTTVNGVAPAATVPPTICNPSLSPNPVAPGTPVGFFNTIDGGQCYVPQFKARQTLGFARVMYKIFNPRFYIGVAYDGQATNYGYPKLNGFGAGLEKLPDLENTISFHGSYYYFWNASAQYTVNDPNSPNFNVVYTQRYAVQTYDVGLNFLFSKTFPVFLTAGWDGDVMVARANAPINQTHSGPYVGLGFRF
ncbi:MAG: copper amine oxidase N-terminal domain-containing protein [Candidatus Eremiobacteraeota bacterium]|nr:copper amine oxidase N-terminal domain-containing protein [Candidatus Eremiobacteraeota bacterium]